MKTVLVVDDNVVIGRMTEAVLDLLGLNTILCEGGKQAIPRISEADALITDFLMPEMNGAELVQEAKRQKPGMPALIITGTLADVPKDHLADGVFGKPFYIEELHSWLRKMGIAE
ncbi:MAG: response regulator [bacterium]|nr:response regulator [bacterium]